MIVWCSENRTFFFFFLEWLPFTFGTMYSTAGKIENTEPAQIIVSGSVYNAANRRQRAHVPERPSAPRTVQQSQSSDQRCTSASGPPRGARARSPWCSLQINHTGLITSRFLNSSQGHIFTKPHRSLKHCSVYTVCFSYRLFSTKITNFLQRTRGRYFCHFCCTGNAVLGLRGAVS